MAAIFGDAATTGAWLRAAHAVSVDNPDRLPGISLHLDTGNAMYAQLEIDVQNDEIAVSLPRTNYRLSYYKPANSRGLCGKAFPTKTDPRAPICQAKFLAHAWQAANNKAQELGWIASTSIMGLV